MEETSTRNDTGLQGELREPSDQDANLTVKEEEEGCEAG